MNPSPIMPTTDAWTPANVILVIMAVAWAAVTIVGALKGIQAKSQGDEQTNRINNIANRLRDHDIAIKQIAMAVPGAGTELKEATQSPSDTATSPAETNVGRFTGNSA